MRYVNGSLTIGAIWNSETTRRCLLIAKKRKVILLECSLVILQTSLVSDGEEMDPYTFQQEN